MKTNNIKFILFLIFIQLFGIKSFSQQKDEDIPYSFENIVTVDIPKVIMPFVNTARLIKEDEERGTKPPFRIGYPFRVNYDISNIGKWITLSNGDRLWLLKIECKDAVFIGVSFKDYWLPEGVKLFIYDEQKNDFIGPYSSKNNSGTMNNNRGFAAEMVFGDKIIIEYYEPNGVNENVVLSIHKIVHGYRSIFEWTDFGGSASCNRNVACSEGDDWINEKQSVVWWTIDNHCGCSGSLIYSDDENEENNYFLTAEHCIKQAGYPCNGEDYDADTTVGEGAEIDDAIFYYYWESGTCTNPTSPPSYSTTNRATVISNDNDSDFALLQLDGSPLELSPADLFYNGWDRSTSIPTPDMVCIHHPAGDIKKISTDSDPVYIEGDFWCVDNWDTGTTQGGSSGSPLYNSDKRVVGQDSYSDCSGCGPCDSDKGSCYGKFSVSWDNNANNIRQLRHWLDDDLLQGYTFNGARIIRNQTYDGINLTIETHIVKFRNVSMEGNSTVIVDIDEYFYGIDFEVKTGSTFEVK